MKTPPTKRAFLIFLDVICRKFGGKLSTKIFSSKNSVSFKSKKIIGFKGVI